MLLTDHSFDKIGYELSHGAEKLDISKGQLTGLVKKYNLQIYRIGSKNFIPSSELVRVQYILLGEAP